MKGQSQARPPSILVVDDNAENLRLLSQVLSRQGYQVRVASSGERALQSVDAHPPDLILLDVMMPEMDGYEVCQQLKARPESRDIPVIFISALHETLDKVRAFAAGGVDYVTKPLAVQEVLARVKTHMALHTFQVQLQQQVAELDAFARTVAHDLKHPLGLIIPYTLLLIDGLATIEEHDPQELQGYAEVILKTSRKMSDIIDELLLLASVRTLDDVSIEPLDMADIVAGVRERLASVAAQRRAEVVTPTSWPTARGHGPWVEEVWMNLVSNALKYGGRPEEDVPPKVTLGFTIWDPDGGLESPPPLPRGAAPGLTTRLQAPPHHTAFWVCDNGPGLTPEEQARLFVEFTRLHTIQASGHGLGLSIVRRIVERLGGEVGVESTVGEGSCFYFTLPSDTG
jgi:signal transduction histidine kinase